jgi:hypothetical protein
MTAIASVPGCTGRLDRGGDEQGGVAPPGRAMPVSPDVKPRLLRGPRPEVPASSVLMAEATAHLVSAYRVLESLADSPAWFTNPTSFELASHGLCMALVALDDCSASAGW